MRLSCLLVDGDVSLKALDTSAAKGPYLKWMQDLDVIRHLESRHAANSEQSLREFIETANNSTQSLLAGIFAAGRHVGNIKLSIDPHHKRGEMGILIGNKSVWGQGIGRRAIKLLAEYAFDELGVEKLSAGCYEGNLGSIKAFEASGFSIEAVRPGHYIDGDKRVDGVYLAYFNLAPANSV